MACGTRRHDLQEKVSICCEDGWVSPQHARSKLEYHRDEASRERRRQVRDAWWKQTPLLSWAAKTMADFKSDELRGPHSYMPGVFGRVIGDEAQNLEIDQDPGAEERSRAQYRHMGKIAWLGQAGLFSAELKAQLQSVQSEWQ